MIKLLVLAVLLLPMFCTMGPPVKDGMSFGIVKETGKNITVSFERGPDFMHPKKMGFLRYRITPQIAVWMEDTLGNYLGTGYVTRCFGKQKWMGTKPQPDSCFRPMCMPYWLNRFKAAGTPAPTPNRPLPDALCGATPTGGFSINVSLPDSVTAFRLFAEWNSSYDFNAHFSKDNSSFNGQPSIVVCATIDFSDTTQSVTTLKVIGHGGEKGDDATLYHDTQKLTSALSIFDKVTVVVGK